MYEVNLSVKWIHITYTYVLCLLGLITKLNRKNLICCLSYVNKYRKILNPPPPKKKKTKQNKTKQKNKQKKTNKQQGQQTWKASKKTTNHQIMLLILQVWCPSNEFQSGEYVVILIACLLSGDTVFICTYLHAFCLITGDITQKGYEKKRSRLLAPYAGQPQTRPGKYGTTDFTC